MVVFMKKKEMLYLMGIDWNWIYQRPQILADMLCKDYQLTVIFPRSILKSKAAPPNQPGMEFHILWTIPYQEKNRLIGKISALLNTNLFRNINRYQYVFIGYPLYARYIPDSYQGCIIYDCMDNHESLYPDQRRVANVLTQEVKLIRKSRLLTVSSELLQKKMDSIAGYSKSVLIRNGTVLQDIHDIAYPIPKKRHLLGYIGTISSWFDFALLGNSLKAVPEIEYHLIGPMAVKNLSVTGIIYHEPVPHDMLWDSVKEYDCLIMPFIVNDIVSSVDPVKLYEYIAFGKCIISVYYPEIEHFRDFVYFYNNENEYINLLLSLKEREFPPKYNKEQQQSFLNRNTWEKRYEQIKKGLEELKDEC